MRLVWLVWINAGLHQLFPAQLYSVIVSNWFRLGTYGVSARPYKTPKTVAIKMLKSFVLIIWFESEHDVKQIYLSRQIEWYELFLKFLHQGTYPWLSTHLYTWMDIDKVE